MAVRRTNPDGTMNEEPEDRSTFAQRDDSLRDLIAGDRQNYPIPFVDYQPDEIAGNTERGRDIGGGGQGSPYGPMGGGASKQPTSIDMGLPQGVTVDEGMFSGVPEDGNAMNVPGQSRVPSPTSGMAMNAPPESGFSQGPMRRSASSPSIYGESRNPKMFGRAGGLLGGGKGLVGQEESSGPIAPTEMMKKLIQLFQQQGG